MNEIVKIKDSLKLHGLDIALKHFEQAEHAFEEGNFEAANSQIRTYIEAIFDAVAAICLKTSQKQGSARKELHRKGIIDDLSSKFLQAFMDLCGGEGSHAGITTLEQTTMRRAIGFQIAILGLSLIPDMIRVEEIIETQLKKPKGTKFPKDSEITTSCPTCQIEQNLYEASIKRDGEETVYTCKNGCQPIVIIGSPEDSPSKGRGYRLGSYVIRNANELRIPIIGTERGILIPASPAALMKKSPRYH